MFDASIGSTIFYQWWCTRVITLSVVPWSSMVVHSQGVRFFLPTSCIIKIMDPKFNTYTLVLVHNHLTGNASKQNATKMVLRQVTQKLCSNHHRMKALEDNLNTC